MDDLTISEAAEKYGLSRDSLKQAVHRGAVPSYVKYGLRWVKPSDVERYKETAKRGRPRTDASPSSKQEKSEE